MTIEVTKQQRDFARKICEDWQKGLSVAATEYIGKHDITALQEDIAFALSRFNLHPDKTLLER